MRADAWPIWLALLGLPIGCTQQSPQTSLAQVEQGLITAERLALSYVTLPQCVVSGQPLCSERTVIAQIKAADAVAYNAIFAARQAPGDEGKALAAAAAVGALKAAVPLPSSNEPPHPHL